MPVTVGKSLFPGLSNLEQACLFQQRHIKIMEKRQIDSIESMRRKRQEIKHRTEMYQREVEKLKAASLPFESELLKVMSKEHLDHLVSLGEEAVSRMTFDEIQDPSYRSRSMSRDTNRTPRTMDFQADRRTYPNRRNEDEERRGSRTRHTFDMHMGSQRASHDKREWN